jgi:uncharacterized membrane protein required for colicin V production
MNNADVVIAVILLVGFLLGFAQGSPRALVALGGWFVAFIVAAHLREPIGQFLATNATRYADGYAQMLAFGGAFIVLLAIVLVAVTFTYKDMRHLTRFNLADEFVGGVLGTLVMLLVVTATVVVLDSYYVPASVVRPGAGPPAEIGWITQLDSTLAGSGIANALRSSLIPGLGAVLDPLLPLGVHSVMR